MEKYISFKQNGESGMYCISGMTVYDEKLIGGKLVSRYCNPCGQIMPEMHLPDSLFSEENEGVFRITVQGKELSDGWYAEKTFSENDSFCVNLLHKENPLRVTVKTHVDGYGWITRELRIENTGNEYLPLDSVMPFAGKLWRHRFDNVSSNLNYTPEECGITLESLYEVGYSERSVWGQEGDFGFHGIDEKGLTYDAEMNGRSGWSRPAFVLRDNMNGQLFCCEFAYSENWEMQLLPSLDSKETAISFGIGIKAPQGEYVRVLAPGEAVDTPAVHFTLCANGMQELILSRHRFVREEIMPQNDPIGQCLIEANHRGYLCDRENEEDIKKDISVAAEVGAELYVIDAGWYGREPNHWYNNAGDWFAGSWLPNDLYPIISHAKKLGMKFGLWMEFEAAGENTNIRMEHPEFLMRRHGEECAQGRAIDLSNPDAAQWVENEIVKVITRYDLDMFRIDHNHWINEGGTREVGGFTENVMWRYIENFYGIFARLRERFPNVSFQNCAAGGGRLDLGILRYFHHTEVSDWARPPRVMRIFNGMLMQLPPEIQLRIFGTEVCEHVQDSDVISQLHDVMQSRMIFRGIAPSLEELATPLKKLLQKELLLYKKELRPILTGKCKVYRHTQQNGIFDPVPWSANEFAMPDGSRAFAVVQKLSVTEEEHFVLRFLGLRNQKYYRVYLDRENDFFEATGKELAQNGVSVQIDNLLGSELILVSEI